MVHCGCLQDGYENRMVSFFSDWDTSEEQLATRYRISLEERETFSAFWKIEPLGVCLVVVAKRTSKYLDNDGLLLLLLALLGGSPPNTKSYLSHKSRVRQFRASLYNFQIQGRAAAAADFIANISLASYGILAEFAHIWRFIT